MKEDDKSTVFFFLKDILWMPILAIVVIAVFVAMICWLSDKEERCNECMQSIRHVEYEGHTYLVYNSGYKFGICHDENCKCKKVSCNNK